MMTRKLLLKYPCLFFSETIAIMDRELKLIKDMDVALVKCCLDVLVDSDKIKSYQINYGELFYQS